MMAATAAIINLGVRTPCKARIGPISHIRKLVVVTCPSVFLCADVGAIEAEFPAQIEPRDVHGKLVS